MRGLWIGRDKPDAAVGVSRSDANGTVRSSALWDKRPNGDSRSSALWGKGGRGFVLVR